MVEVWSGGEISLEFSGVEGARDTVEDAHRHVRVRWLLLVAVSVRHEFMPYLPLWQRHWKSNHKI